MRPQPTPDVAAPPIRRGVLVLSGHRITVTTHNGRLHVSDTLGRDKRTAAYSRANCPFQRLVLLGGGGYLSLAAVEWLADLKIPLLHFHPSGRLLLATG